MKNRGSDVERKHKGLFLNFGWDCIRAAGSLGTDLIAISPPRMSWAGRIHDVVYVECKSTERKTFNFSNSERLNKQYLDLKRLHDAGYNVVVMVRWYKVKEHRGWDEIDRSDVYPFPLDDLIVNDFPILRRGEGRNFRNEFKDYTK